VAINSNVDIFLNKPSADETVLLSQDSADNFQEIQQQNQNIQELYSHHPQQIANFWWCLPHVSVFFSGC
jgi:hypothetical protein